LKLFQDRKFDLVMHCSARSLVGESVQNPALYYRNNVIGTFNLIEAMRKYGVKSFVFSSSAAIYGNPLQDKINEDHPKQPINPNGKSKLMVDQMLDDYFKACGMNSVSLRYFNAAGQILQVS
jgi:UDP-glucose 4-epimerase